VLKGFVGVRHALGIFAEFEGDFGRRPGVRAEVGYMVK